jgi:ribosomal protein S18 acetylase RimI-like enzyme
MSTVKAAEFSVRPAIFPADNETVSTLFMAYAQSLPLKLDFQNFERELADLPGKYAEEKGGAVFVAYTTSSGLEVPKERAIGIVAVRAFAAPETCELKRLYVMPSSRGLGVSKLLLDAVLATARELGYKEMLLDTLCSMTPARGLYERYGFTLIEKYYDSVEGVVFYKLVL